MTTTRNPDQRARFVRAAASDLNVAPELAERLLFLSEAARAYERTGGRIAAGTIDALQDCLLDDDVSRYGWWAATAAAEQLWRRLLRTAMPPRDVGPAVLLAAALARRGAADEAMRTLAEVDRAGEFRRSAIEMSADLAEDAGRPAQAWAHILRLGLADPDAEWSALRCVLGCSRRRRCERSRLSGVTHARWLRQRIGRWWRRPWSGGEPGGTDGSIPSPEPRPPQWSEIVGGYLTARSSVLPVGERQLLDRWLPARRASLVVVVAAGRWEAELLDQQGRSRHAGWEAAAPRSVVAGDVVTGWLLPTMLPAEHLLVRSTVAAPW